MKIYLLTGLIISIVFLLSALYYIKRGDEDIKEMYDDMELLIGLKATVISFVILITFFYPFVLTTAAYQIIKEKESNK